MFLILTFSDPLVSHFTQKSRSAPKAIKNVSTRIQALTTMSDASVCIPLTIHYSFVRHHRCIGVCRWHISESHLLYSCKQSQAPIKTLVKTCWWPELDPRPRSWAPVQSSSCSYRVASESPHIIGLVKKFIWSFFHNSLWKSLSGTAAQMLGDLACNWFSVARLKTGWFRWQK